jgi:hypothetical protein
MHQQLKMHHTLMGLRVFGLGLLIATGLWGCARNVHSTVDFNYNDDGQPEAVKRVERHPEVNFWNHWRREAYHPPKPEELTRLGPGESTVLQTWGAPDYVRKPFTSVAGQRIREWIYLKNTDKPKVFQFREGRLVYDGPLTDYERILLRRGYPDSAVAIHTESAPRTDIFVYQSVFDPSVENFKFSDGKLIQAKEGD